MGRNYIKFKTRAGATIHKNGDRPWTFRKHRDGKRYNFQLGPSRSEAAKVANEINTYLYFHSIEEAMAKFQPGKSKHASEGVPTFGQLLEIVDGAALVTGLEKRTVRSYHSAIKSFAECARKKNPMEASINELTPDLLAKMRRQLLHGVTDEVEKIRKMRTANARLRNMKAVFSKDKRPFMKSWDLTGVADFLECRPYGKLKTVYQLPAYDLIKKTFGLYEKYDGAKKAMLGLALFFGLRRKEIFHTRRSWFDLSKDKAYISIQADKSFKPKAWVTGATWGLKSKAQEILDAAPADDYLFIHRKRSGEADEVVKDLKDLGWPKYCAAMHECRKLYGSYLANKEGLYVAQKALRHSSPQITSDTYADIILDRNIIEFWENEEENLKVVEN